MRLSSFVIMSKVGTPNGTMYMASPEDIATTKGMPVTLNDPKGPKIGEVKSVYHKSGVLELELEIYEWEI